MQPPAATPPGLIPVPMKGAVLLLTGPEFAAGLRRGKVWRRRVEIDRREVLATCQTPPRASQDAAGGGTGPTPYPDTSLARLASASLPDPQYTPSGG
jgi:hypothetical protein